MSFLHGYANPAHEQRMRDVLAREHPEAYVSLSSEVWPEIGHLPDLCVTVPVLKLDRFSDQAAHFLSRLPGHHATR